MRQIRGDELRRLIAVQANAERRAALQELVAVRLPLVEAHDDGPRRRNRLRALASTNELVDELTVLDRAPLGRLAFFAVDGALERLDADAPVRIEEALVLLAE